MYKGYYMYSRDISKALLFKYISHKYKKYVLLIT